MTELYRGLLLVLTNIFNELILGLRKHIQSFNQDIKSNNSEFNFGVLGFWNLMLEITFTLFVLGCLVTGVSLIACLAVVFYPCHGFVSYGSFILKNIKAPESSVTEKSLDDLPIIIKNDDKEKK